MNRWKVSKSWVLVWGFYLLVGGMIIYSGYFATLYLSSQERTSRITSETGQSVSALTADDPLSEETVLIMQTQIGEMTADDQASVSHSSPINQEIAEEKSLEDFPSPVQGSSLRSVGNYYSEAFDSYLFHAGVDYAEPEGTMIRATHEGKVIFSGVDPILGHKVTLDCGGGWLVTYGGLANLRVQVGDTVETQDALGQVGLFKASESESNQPQLHYEVWHGDAVQRF